MTQKVKIAFVGTHGVGKTTLLHALKDCEEIKNNKWRTVKLIEETAAKVFEMGKNNPALVINQGATLEAQLTIIGMQIQDEQSKRQEEVSTPQELMICDRSILDAVVYTHSRIMSDDTYPWARDLSRFLYNWVWSTNEEPYDIIFYLPISFPLQSTDIRPGDLEFQERIDKLMQGVFIGQELDGVPLDDFSDICHKVVVLAGDTESRVKTALKYINEAYDSKQ